MAKRRIKTSYGCMIVDDEHKSFLENKGVEGILESGQFPCVRSAEGSASMAGKGSRLRETINKIKSEPINIARGHRTMEQQNRKYGKLFEENSKITKRVRRDSRMAPKGSERFELVGQIPREALLEEARKSGVSVAKLVEDTDRMSHIAKKSGYLNT